MKKIVFLILSIAIMLFSLACNSQVSPDRITSGSSGYTSAEKYTLELGISAISSYSSYESSEISITDGQSNKDPIYEGKISTFSIDMKSRIEVKKNSKINICF